MPSLCDLLSSYAAILLIDATSARVQAGFLQGADQRWAESSAEAGTGVFEAVEALGVSIPQVKAFVFAEAPGSILGIRTSAVALRTWCALEKRPVYAYHALSVLAEAHGPTGPAFLTDARRNLWHLCRFGERPRKVATADVSGPLATPEGFRHWAPLPLGTAKIPYSVKDLLLRVNKAELFRPTEAPDAWRSEETSYVTWTPQIHRAP